MCCSHRRCRFSCRRRRRRRHSLLHSLERLNNKWMVKRLSSHSMGKHEAWWWRRRRRRLESTRVAQEGITFCTTRLGQKGEEEVGAEAAVAAKRRAGCE